MYKNINLDGFKQAFKTKGRGSQFSNEALEALYNYHNDTDYELDVVELCCNWTECPIEEALEDYSMLTLEELCESTLVLDLENDNILYLDF